MEHKLDGFATNRLELELERYGLRVSKANDTPFNQDKSAIECLTEIAEQNYGHKAGYRYLRLLRMLWVAVVRFRARGEMKTVLTGHDPNTKEQFVQEQYDAEEFHKLSRVLKLVDEELFE